GRGFSRGGIQVLRMKKRQALIGLFLAAILWPASAGGKVYIDINAPGFSALPIAIPKFEDNSLRKEHDPATGVYLSEVISGDLKKSGLFFLLDPRSFLPTDPRRRKDTIDFRRWTIVGAEVVVLGSYWFRDKAFMAEVGIYDAVQGQRIAAKQYGGSKAGVKRIAHKIANEILYQFTGRPGAFDTSIAFVSNRTGAKEIYVMDCDGSEVEQLTRNNSINLLPRWSHDRRNILYTSYRHGTPGLYVLDMLSMRSRRLIKNDRFNTGGVSSPDGSRIAFVSSRTGNADIYTMNADGTDVRQVTKHWALDVSPAWSPDGDKIAFISDRKGNPHVFVMNADGTDQRRFSYVGKYCASPKWSPDGHSIAFVCREKGGPLQIMLADLAGGRARQITYGPEGKEDPSWSPDGRFIAFSLTQAGNSDIYLVNVMGGVPIRLTATTYDETNPEWSPAGEN
ncbi:Tol-Pal system beta propeller repeat protein TolB, partial [Thermodesulfobacteriota bacterium]